MKRIVLAVAALAAMGSMFIAPVFAQVAPEKGKVTVALGSAMSVDSVIKTLQGGTFDQVTVQGSFTVKGQTIQDFVTISPNQGAGDVSSKWSDGRKSLIAELNKNGFFDKNAKFASSLPSTDDSAVFMVKNVTVFGEKQTALNVAGKFAGTHSSFQSSNGGGSTVGKNPNKAQPVFPISGVTAFAVANTPYYTLLPISGSVSTGLFTAPGVTNPTRGAVNYMGWNTNGFANDQTYEHDFFLDAAGGTYFARSFSLPPYCQPLAVYAATSWPSTAYPYLDSDLEGSITSPCTSSGNIAYTIGAAQANAIPAGMTHFTALLMPSGDATADTFLLQGQVGYQLPAGCHDVLCSFAYGYASGYKETTHYGLKSGTVPGSVSWTTPIFTPDTPVLGITGVAAPVTNITSSSLTLNFVDITWDETNISAERSIGVSGPWTTFNFGALNAGNKPGGWSWNNTGLSSHTQYCFRMRATNNNGSSAYSSITCGTTL